MSIVSRLAARVAQSPGPAAGRLRERFAARLAERGESNPAHNAMSAAGPFDLPPGTHVLRDLAYGRDPAQCLDIYLPPLAEDAKLIVMVHGGGWMRGDKALLRSVKNKVLHWVGRGVVLVSVNYRLLPQARPLEQADDIAQALAFTQREAASWGADASSAVLMGHSAGAHLVSLVAADPSIAAGAGAQPWRATVTIDSAAFDLVRIMASPHFSFYDRAFGADPDEWRSASPFHRLRAKPTAPWLTIHSALRGDSAGQAEAFAAKANALGGSVDVLSVGLAHGDLNDLLGVPGAYTEAVDAFLHDAWSR